MNSKLEKYYQYIINDMIDNTKIIHSPSVGPHDVGCEILIVTPWMDVYCNSQIYTLRSKITNDYTSLIESQYGARKSDYEEILNRYVDVISQKIKV